MKDKIPSLDWQDLDDYTQRARVHGGWLVKSINGYEWRESICFVPDPDSLWYDDSL